MRFIVRLITTLHKKLQKTVVICTTDRRASFDKHYELDYCIRLGVSVICALRNNQMKHLEEVAQVYILQARERVHHTQSIGVGTKRKSKTSVRLFTHRFRRYEKRHILF